MEVTLEVVIVGCLTAGLLATGGWAFFYRKPRSVEDHWRILREWGHRTCNEINAEKKIVGGGG